MKLYIVFRWIMTSFISAGSSKRFARTYCIPHQNKMENIKLLGAQFIRKLHIQAYVNSETGLLKQTICLKYSRTMLSIQNNFITLWLYHKNFRKIQIYWARLLTNIIISFNNQVLQSNTTCLFVLFIVFIPKRFYHTYFRQRIHVWNNWGLQHVNITP